VKCGVMKCVTTVWKKFNGLGDYFGIFSQKCKEIFPSREGILNAGDKNF